MHNLVSRLRTLFGAKIGRCARCMRQSLASAVSAWAFFGVGSQIWPNTSAQDLIGLAASVLTALWLMHVATYVARAVADAAIGNAPSWEPGRIAPALAGTKPGIDQPGRRRVLGVLLRAASIGVVASVPVLLLPSRALAFCGQCTIDDDCGGSANGWCCKNTAPVNAGYVCNECKAC